MTEFNTKQDFKELEQVFQSLTPAERVKRLFELYGEKEILLTSSFGTSAVLLLSLISENAPGSTVYFIDTGYHFPETLEYKQALIEKLDIKVVDIHPEDWEHEFTTSDRTWEKNPDFCCSVNKVKPLNKVKEAFSIWVSGLIGFQNSFRAQKGVFDVREDIDRFYPLIDVTEQWVAEYMTSRELPQHPLKTQGFASVGCTHCTIEGEDRSGRWMNSEKTECGLHT